ncbi:MAG: hypothetical protein IVW55_17570 [Chloroflexi bacterium]|nr:hypothetical protein [Chloroflexota bacterium]
MAALHISYLFDWNHFKAEAESLIEAADAGDAARVRDRAAEITGELRFRGQQWILENPWSNPLPDVAGWTVPLNPEQVGSCFLVVLATHLSESPASLLTDWPLLNAGLSALGWSERDTAILTKGWTTGALLRPDRIADPLLRPDLSLDLLRYNFAWRVTTTYGDVGWLDTATVYQMRERLIPLRDQLAHLNAERLQCAGPAATTRSLLMAYDRALIMLCAAVETNTGLFMTVS